MVVQFYVLAVILLLGFSRSQEFQGDQENNEEKPLCCDKFSDGSFSTNCQRTKLWAGSKDGFASTPNFPGRFPILKKCIWEIYTRPSRRIRVDFRDFYLIGPGDDGVCYSQNVVITAPLSGLRVGPHCGNAGIPSVVSAGNFMIVELISNIPMTSENFRGFRMAFRETSESPSRGLVSQNMKEDVPIPEELESGVGKAQNENSLPTAKTTKFTTKRPWRVRLGGRLPTLLPPVEPIVPERKKESKTFSLSPMVIVGIAAGGIVLLALSATFGMKAWSRRKQTHKSNETKITKSVDSPVPEAGVSNNEQPAPEYHVYYYENPYVHDERGKHKSHQKKQNSSERKSRNKGNRGKTLPDEFIGVYPLEPVSSKLYEAESQISLKSYGYIHNIKPVKVRKAASIAPPLSLNPPSRRSAKPTNSKSLTKLKELRNAKIIDQNTATKTEKTVSTINQSDPITHKLPQSRKCDSKKTENTKSIKL